MYVCAPHLWLVPEEGIRSPELELQWLCPTLWVVGSESWSSEPSLSIKHTQGTECKQL